jgi:hypothetical protein
MGRAQQLKFLTQELERIKLSGPLIRFYVFPYQFTGERFFPCQFTQKH